jgi:DNA-binding NarL/FixJ family response regulator
VLIADDHRLIRRSICSLLDSQGDIEVVATADNGEDVVTLAQDHNPDIIVMDISMPKASGLDALDRIRSLNLSAHIVIFSMHANAILCQQALKKGAKGYILKQHAYEELPQAIRTVQQGRLYFSDFLSRLYLPNPDI